ncbi:MAG: hypothetical protein ACI4RA_08070 [Kiritimatiellia bacterium]
MKRITQIGLSVGTMLFGLAVRAEGEIWPGDGAWTMSKIEAFGEVDLPFTLGTGLLRYTGSTATLAKDVALSPAEGLPATIRVVEPGTRLTLAGNVTQTDGAFIKDGPGTLVFGGLANVVGQNRGDGRYDTTLIEWDEETGRLVHGAQGYATFTINDGGVVMGGPGAMNTTTGAFWVGSRTQRSTSLDIVGGQHVHQNDWFSISRGAGTTDNDVTARMSVSGGADVSLSGLCINFPNGQPKYYGRSLLDIKDRATVSVLHNVFIGEGDGEARVHVGPDSRLIAFQEEGFEDGIGFQIGRSSSAKADVTVDGGELYYHVGYVRAGSKLTVKNGGVVHMDRTLPTAVRENYGNGDVLVDGGTFAPWTTIGHSGTMSDWFNGSTGGFGVGAGGATLDTPAFTHLGMQPVRAAEGAAITKTGRGVLTMYPSEIPVTAREGTLRMSVSPKAWTNGLTGAIAMAEGAALEVSGDMALGAMRVEAAEATFDASGIERDRNWVCSRYASWRPDGVVQATAAINNGQGSAVVLDANVPVDRSFELAFDAFLYSTSDRPADGWTIYFQKAGNTTVGNDNYGYGGVGDSFGVAVDVYNSRILWGENGTYLRECGTAGTLGLYGTWAERRHCSLAYDAEAHRATLTIRQPDGREASWSHDVDIAKLVGANEAYLGFAGGTYGLNAAFSFSNIRFVETGTQAAHVRVGGVKTLDAGETFTARTHPSEAQNGFLMGRLDYADGATLNVEDDLAATGLAVPPPLTTADQSLWQLGDGAYWRPDGSLALSRLLDGSITMGHAVTTAYYPFGGNWESDFTFELGAHGEVPGDQFVWQLLGPSGSLNVQIRYYEENRTKICLLMCGALHPSSGMDLGQVDVLKHGPARVHLAYDDAVHTLTVSMTQENGARSTCVVFADVDMAAVTQANTTAQIWLWGNVGGNYSENVVRDFTFRSDLHDARLARKPVRGFFGFERLEGSGTLVKTGAGDLGLVDTRNGHAALRLAEGGLRLRREPLEDLALDVPAGWCFSRAGGRYVYPNGIQIGELVDFHMSTAQTRHRLRVDGDWRCSFSLWVNDGTPADAVSFFLHNDPRGNQCEGGNTAQAGFDGIGNSVAVAWNFYSGGDNTLFSTVTVARNGENLDWTQAQKHEPLTLPGKTTDVVLTYNAETKTLTSVMTQGETSVENTFADFDVAGSVKDAYAWLGFGVGCGGYAATPRITNLRFERLDDRDVLAGESYLASVDVTGDATIRLDTAKAGGIFRLADTVTLAAGKALAAESCDRPATLAMGALTLGEGSALAGDADTVIAPETLVGALGTVAMKGATLAVPLAQVEARALKDSTLVLTGGAKVAVPKGWSLSLRRVVVDDVDVGTGVFTAETAGWVASGAVTLGNGTIVILR